MAKTSGPDPANPAPLIVQHLSRVCGISHVDFILPTLTLHCAEEEGRRAGHSFPLTQDLSFQTEGH